jgi:NAD(P)-dependent dehydrogenase (short-subunit alcohol dehydrogenase family)
VTHEAGRVALVQGASRGIGLALVETLLESNDALRVVATSRDPERSEGLAGLRRRHADRLVCERLDVRDEASIRSAAERVASYAPRLHWLLQCAGVLHDGTLRPEKRIEDADPEQLRRVFEVNAFGPLLVAKHFLALLRHPERAVLANLSARVGSIEDNRIGGWYGYRASKAAQNMFTRTLAIELRRRAPRVICVALHPGTVATALSEPFRGSFDPARVFTPRRAAEQIWAVVQSLSPEDGGRFLDWAGKPIPW